VANGKDMFNSILGLFSVCLVFYLGNVQSFETIFLMMGRGSSEKQRFELIDRHIIQSTSLVRKNHGHVSSRLTKLVKESQHVVEMTDGPAAHNNIFATFEK
jgi:hypothetical protein